MKKILKSALLLALCATGAQAATNKTFLMPRSHGVNLAMEYTTWNELLQTKDEDRFGANFQVTGFYQDSTNESDIGKYFGVANKNFFEVKRGTNGDVSGGLLVHNYNQVGDFLGAKVTLEPEQKAYGVRIDYYQDLEKILKGLFFKVALPIVHVENDMQVKFSDKGTELLGTNIEKFFKGTYEGTEANAQAKLTHALIDGTSHDSTGVADIDFVLGYKFLDKEKYHASINLGLTIPVGDEADGKYVFEPIVGNGNHWAFGGGLDFGAKLWDDEDQNIKLAMALNYRYLFEGTEKRTLGLKNYAWGQYYGVGKPDATQVTVTPAANILTTNVDVEPGSQLDAILGLAYNNGGFTFDLGYNFFWKDSEDVGLKSWSSANEEYAVVAADHKLDTALNSNTTAHWNGATYAASQLTKANIDTSVAESESQVTHKIYGGMGYIFKDWEYPVLLGLGGSYEFADQDTIEGWGAWLKLGIAF